MPGSGTNSCRTPRDVVNKMPTPRFGVLPILIPPSMDKGEAMSASMPLHFVRDAAP